MDLGRFEPGRTISIADEPPWAAVLSIVHSLGGDADMAQRIWYTGLFMGAALGALGLMAALRLGRIAALVGSFVYVLESLCS